MLRGQARRIPLAFHPAPPDDGLPEMPLAPLLYLIFYLSGASALVFESLWFFQAGLALGNSIWASSLVLASFMAGLAVGNAWVSLRGDRIRRPIRLYATLELVIAFTGVGIVFLLPHATPLLAPWLGSVIDQPLGLNLLRMGLGFGLMLIPATAMGATLPLLVSALYRQRAHFGEALGKLYGWNTLGAVCGVLIGEILLLEICGVRGAAMVAASCNIVAALLSFSVDRFLERGGGDALPERPSEAMAPGAASMGILLTAFGLGALLLALEVVWFRFLILFMAGTSYTFAVMLAVVLAGIGIGGLLGSLCLRAFGACGRFVPALQFLAGTLCLWLYLGFESYSEGFIELSAASPEQILGLALPLMFPVALISGLLFTLLGDELHRKLGTETRSAGLLTLANTVGAALGSLVSGFILLPSLGIEKTLFVLALGYGVLGVWSLVLGPRPQKGLAWGLSGLLAAVLGVAVVGFPHGTLEKDFLMRALASYVPPEKVVAIRESLTETIVYTRRDIFGEPRSYRLITNNHSMSATSPNAHRYMKLFVYLPVALHESPRKALLISYGIGATARALADTEELETIDIVDISEDILEMSRLLVSQGRESLEEVVLDSPLDDPRVSVHVEDGRFFLQTTNERFDIITGEPPPPKLAGIVNLYTREYFHLIRDRLAEGGIVSYWLPVHSLLEEDSKAILRGFCDVFEDCSLWTGAGLDWIMLGSRRGHAAAEADPPSARHIARQFEDAVVGPEMAALGLEKKEQIGALFLADAEQIGELTAGAAPLADNFPKRLSSRVEVGDHTAWMDVDTTRARFEASSGIEKILPADLREAALAFFEAQGYINAHFGVRPLDASSAAGSQLPTAHRFMDEEGLKTLPLWLLEADYDIVRAARNAASGQYRMPLLHYERGVWALVSGDWVAAEKYFGRAAKLASPGPYLGLRAYAFCRAGNFAAGRRFAKQFRQLAGPDRGHRLSGFLDQICESSTP